RRWKEAAALPVPATRKDWLDTVHWARAIGAARSGDVPGAEADVKELTQLVADREKRARKEGYGVSNEKATDLREAEAWLAFAKGNPDEALQELRAAADHQDKNGGESVSVPAREMIQTSSVGKLPERKNGRSRKLRPRPFLVIMTRSGSPIPLCSSAASQSAFR